MNITKTVNGKDFIVSIDGRLDTTTAPQFEEFMVENISKMSTLTLDCTGLEYVSSAGLRVLLSAQKRLKGGMKLKNVCELVMEVFEMTGFVDILVIESRNFHKEKIKCSQTYVKLKKASRILLQSLKKVKR